MLLLVLSNAFIHINNISFWIVINSLKMSKRTYACVGMLFKEFKQLQFGFGWFWKFQNLGNWSPISFDKSIPRIYFFKLFCVKVFRLDMIFASPAAARSGRRQYATDPWHVSGIGHTKITDGLGTVVHIDRKGYEY